MCDRSVNMDLLGIGVRVGTYLQVLSFTISLLAGFDVKNGADTAIVTAFALLLSTLAAMVQGGISDFGLLACLNLILAEVTMHAYYTFTNLGPNDSKQHPNLLREYTLQRNYYGSLVRGRISQARFWTSIILHGSTYAFALFIWSVGVFWYHDDACGNTYVAVIPGWSVQHGANSLAMAWYVMLAVLNVILPVAGWLLGSTCCTYLRYQWQRQADQQRQTDDIPYPTQRQQLMGVKIVTKFVFRICGWPTFKISILLCYTVLVVVSAEVYVASNFRRNRYVGFFQPGQFFPFLVGLATFLQVLFKAYNRFCSRSDQHTSRSDNNQQGSSSANRVRSALPSVEEQEQEQARVVIKGLDGQLE